MPEQDRIENVFDFIDYLEKFNRESGTANENRAFVFNSLAGVFEQLSTEWDLYSAYQDVGISIPENVFNNIIDIIGATSSNAYMIQAFAPTSKVNIEDIPTFTGALETQYIVYSDALVYNPTTGDSFVEQWYHKFDDILTTSQLAERVANDIFTVYGYIVSDVNLLRIYQRE
jgi:hypothetical protein